MRTQAPQPPPFKLTIGESIDRIKEEFSFLQAQYNRYEKHDTNICSKSTKQFSSRKSYFLTDAKKDSRHLAMIVYLTNN